MKLGGCWGWEGRRSDASPPMEKGRRVARSFCMIYHVKLGQVTLVPLGTQLCRGYWERAREQGSSPLAPPLAASPEPAFSNNQKSGTGDRKNDTSSFISTYSFSSILLLLIGKDSER